MIGSQLAQPRLEDLRPIRTHWALIGIVLLMAPLYWIALQFHPEFAINTGGWAVTVTGTFFIGFLMFTALLGGPQKIWTDWRDRNWYGYFWVLWQTKPNHLDGHFVNRKNLPNVVVPGWSLYVPLGGEYNRPFLSYRGASPAINRSVNFRIIKAVCGQFAGGVDVDEVTVKDNTGDRITMHPATIIGQLELRFPNGEGDEVWTHGLLNLWMADQERARQATLVVQTKLEKTQAHLATFRHATGDAISTLGKLGAALFLTNRLKSTKEGKAIGNRLGAVHLDLHQRTFNAMRGTTEVGELVAEPTECPARTGLHGFA